MVAPLHVLTLMFIIAAAVETGIAFRWAKRGKIPIVPPALELVARSSGRLSTSSPQ